MVSNEADQNLGFKVPQRKKTALSTRSGPKNREAIENRHSCLSRAQERHVFSIFIATFDFSKQLTYRTEYAMKERIREEVLNISIKILRGVMGSCVLRLQQCRE